MKRIVVDSRKFEAMELLQKVKMPNYKRQEMKYEIIDEIKKDCSIDLDYAPKVLIVLDHCIYFSLDRGYSYFGKETIMEWCKVSESTVEKAFRILKDSGLFIIAYKKNPNKKTNGIKTPVIIYKKHINFTYIADILNIEKGTEKGINEAEIPTDSKAEEANRVSTYNQPNKTSLKDLSLESLDKTFIPNFVSEEFIEFTWKYYKDPVAVTKLWGVVKKAAKKFGFSNSRLLDMSSSIIEALKGTILAYKANRIRKGFHNYFYGAVYKKLQLEQTPMDIKRMNGEFDDLPF